MPSNDAPRLRWEGIGSRLHAYSGHMRVASILDGGDRFLWWTTFDNRDGTAPTESAAKAAAESAWAEWLDMAGLQPSEGRAHG